MNTKFAFSVGIVMLHAGWMLALFKRNPDFLFVSAAGIILLVMIMYYNVLCSGIPFIIPHPNTTIQVNDFKELNYRSLI